MAHEITVRENGLAEAMYAFKPAWHGLGQVVQDAPTSADAMKLAGLMWEVEQHPLQTIVSQEKMDRSGNPTIETEIVPVPNMVANVRSDNRKVLGVVSTWYKPVQNFEAFNFVDGLVADGSIRYEAAGSLKGGRTVWLLARMPGDLVVAPGDTTQRYILFVNGHDGLRAVRVMPTSVRVVCQNTLNLALNQNNAERSLIIPHMGDIHGKLDAARTVLGLVSGQFTQFATHATKMAFTGITHDEQARYIYDSFPDDDDPDADNTQRENVRREIAKLLDDGPQAIPSIRGSVWATFNAVTQYIDHQARRTGRSADEKAENRMNSILMGPGAKLKAQAWSNALSLVADWRPAPEGPAGSGGA